MLKTYHIHYTAINTTTGNEAEFIAVVVASTEAEAWELICKPKALSFHLLSIRVCQVGVALVKEVEAF